MMDTPRSILSWHPRRQPLNDEPFDTLTAQTTKPKARHRRSVSDQSSRQSTPNSPLFSLPLRSSRAQIQIRIDQPLETDTNSPTEPTPRLWSIIRPTTPHVDLEPTDSDAHVHRRSVSVGGMPIFPLVQSKRKVPWKRVLLALGLTLFGVCVLIAAVVAYALEEGESAFWKSTRPLLVVVGLLLFVPGFYYVRIAYLAYRGTPGYDFSLIPED